MKIEFLLPSKQRPSKFFDTVENIKENALTDNWGIISIHEEGDVTMNNRYVKERFEQYPFLKPFFINSTGKVNAINQGVDYLSNDTDIVILVADDIRFTVKGFDYFVLEDMLKYWPDFSGLLHYPEPAVNERQITMPVMGINIIKRFGYIYHNSYVSLWCDTEQLEVSKRIGKHKYINRLFFHHLHPVWNLAPYDDLYRYNESFYQSDSKNYFERMAINFDL